MTYSHPLGHHPDAATLRKRAGRYLKDLRTEAGLTQQEVAKVLGLDYYTMVSQIENGKTRVPPDKLLPWAKALNAEPAEFGRELLRFYDPFMWTLLFGRRKLRAFLTSSTLS